MATYGLPVLDLVCLRSLHALVVVDYQDGVAWLALLSVFNGDVYNLLLDVIVFILVYVNLAALIVHLLFLLVLFFALIVVGWQHVSRRFLDVFVFLDYLRHFLVDLVAVQLAVGLKFRHFFVFVAVTPAEVVGDVFVIVVHVILFKFNCSYYI